VFRRRRENVEDSFNNGLADNSGDGLDSEREAKATEMYWTA
jgi:hypothetical protein